MATIATREMTAAARQVLRLAAEHYRTATSGDGWFRPRTIGGTSTNRYASHLALLVHRGLIERRDAAPTAWREIKLWDYRITPAGLAELEPQPEHRGGWYGSRCHGQ